MTTQNKKYQHPRHHRPNPELVVPPRDYYPGQFERMIVDGATPSEVYVYARGLNMAGFPPRVVSHIMQETFEKVPEERVRKINAAFAHDQNYFFRNA